MRGIIITAMFAASLTQAAWRDYEEVRDLSLPASGIGELSIEAGAGSLDVTGVTGLDTIVVKATIQVPNSDADKARELLESRLVLSLDRDGAKARLKGYFENGSWHFGESPLVHLSVQVPATLGLKVDDGSGSMTIRDVSGDIGIDDGSGSIELTAVGGDVRIEDGSGSITVDGVGGDIKIRDGSGSMTVRKVGGSVTVDDGSGSINVSDVEKDLVIEEAGSGSVNIHDVRGRVEQES